MNNKVKILTHPDWDTPVIVPANDFIVNSGIAGTVFENVEIRYVEYEIVKIKYGE